jgi:DNA/RNA endonuclease G (NUC1)
MAPGTEFYIISGGIFDPGHPVIGNGLGIPTRLYKIIIEKNSKTVQAYLMPNEPITPATSWPNYQVPMAAIEQATGMLFNLGQ